MLGIIMAGGQGTRLMPITENRPKPLVNVLGVPVINYVKEALAKSQVSEIIVTTGYKGESLGELVQLWNDESQIRCSVNQETVPMGTAGGVKLLQGKLTSTFIVASGDSVLSSDLNLLLDAHKRSGAKVTMALWEVEDPTQFGIVGLSERQNGNLDGSLSEGYICRFLEKPTKQQAFSRVVNAGLYIVEPDVMEYVPQGEKYDFSRQLFPHLLEMNIPMYGVKLNGAWFDIGTPNELINAQIHLLKNANSLPFNIPNGKFTSNLGYVIDSGSTNSPVHHSVICQNSSVGHDSVVRDSLLMQSSKIGDNCQIVQSIIGENVEIGDYCVINNCVIGDGIKLPAHGKFTDRRISHTSIGNTE